jgi:hypothetical protein
MISTEKMAIRQAIRSEFLKPLFGTFLGEIV